MSEGTFLAVFLAAEVDSLPKAAKHPGKPFSSDFQIPVRSKVSFLLLSKIRRRKEETLAKMVVLEYFARGEYYHVMNLSRTRCEKQDRP